MSRFTGPLKIEEIEPGRRWRLLEPIQFEADAEGSGRLITVPAGTVTDGASIPPMIRTVLAVWGTYGRAACVHDMLYQTIASTPAHRLGCDPPFIHAKLPLWRPIAGLPRERRRRELETQTLARTWADAVFYDAMIACGTARWLAWLMWLAVRLFGGRR